MPNTPNLLSFFRSLRSQYILKQYFYQNSARNAKLSTDTSTSNSFNDFPLPKQLYSGKDI